MADWGNLPKEIVTKIAEHLELYEDIETISMICSPWRSAAKEAKLGACCNKREMSRFVTHHCHDITFYQGEFYGVDTYGKVVKFETASTASNTSSFRVVANLPNTLTLKRISAPVSFKWFYNLVVSGGQLLVVRMVIKYEVRYRTNQQPKCRMRPTRFEVFELDVNNGNINQVLSLGNRSIFI
ncbi:hypothetical protein RDABS01_001928 [Bienertia sinuspersici]